MNEMLDRIEDATRRQQRFVADAISRTGRR
jgi:hypothetical protein